MGGRPFFATTEFVAPCAVAVSLMQSTIPPSHFMLSIRECGTSRLRGFEATRLGVAIQRLLDTGSVLLLLLLLLLFSFVFCICNRTGPKKVTFSK